jgi:hypothetical protein
MVVDCGGSNEGSTAVGPGLTVSNKEIPELPASGGYTEGSVGGGGYGDNIDIAPMASTLLNPFGIIGASTRASSVMPVDAPKIPSWVSPSIWLSVWLLSQ